MEAMEAIKKRRSCRNFLDKQVPANILKEIITAGQQAPISRVGEMMINIAVVRNEKILGMIEDYAKKMGGADEIINITDSAGAKLAQSKISNKFAADKKGDGIFYGGKTLVIVSHKTIEETDRYKICAAEDCACIIENMLIAATDLAVDSVYIYSIIDDLNKSKELRKLLRIPENFRLFGACVLGYASGDYVMPKVVRSVVNYI
jgi:nitroreductase